MGFEISDQVRALNAQLQHFMDEHIYPRERPGAGGIRRTAHQKDLNSA
ncbi:MAG: hypothetical protein ACJ0Q1_02365 [Luminiphilus sp.]